MNSQGLGQMAKIVEMGKASDGAVEVLGMGKEQAALKKILAMIAELSRKRDEINLQRISSKDKQSRMMDE